jgi:hypothetical protein
VAVSRADKHPVTFSDMGTKVACEVSIYEYWMVG